MQKSTIFAYCSTKNLNFALKLVEKKTEIESKKAKIRVKFDFLLYSANILPPPLFGNLLTNPATPLRNPGYVADRDSMYLHMYLLTWFNKANRAHKSVSIPKLVFEMKQFGSDTCMYSTAQKFVTTQLPSCSRIARELLASSS